MIKGFARFGAEGLAIRRPHRGRSTASSGQLTRRATMAHRRLGVKSTSRLHVLSGRVRALGSKKEVVVSNPRRLLVTFLVALLAAGLSAGIASSAPSSPGGKRTPAKAIAKKRGAVKAKTLHGAHGRSQCPFAQGAEASV